jgi:hypothetical protein
MSGTSSSDLDSTANGVQPMELYEDEEEEDLDLSKKDTKVWLVKVPNFLMEQWATQSTRLPNQDLGRLKIYKEYLLSCLETTVYFCSISIWIPKAPSRMRLGRRSPKSR